jgi:fucose permease
MSIAGVSGLIGSATVGPAIARFGTRRVMLVAGSLVSLSLAVVGLAATPFVLLVGLVGMLTFDVLVDVAMNMQGSWLSGRRHAPVMNRLHGLWSLGTVLGGISSARIAAAGVSLSAHLVGAAAVLFVVVVIVSRGVLRVDEHPQDTRATDAAADEAPRAGRRPSAILVLFLLAGFFAVAIESTSIEWAAFRFTDDFGAAAGFAALGYVAVTGGMTVGRFAGDWVAVRLGARRLTSTSIALTAVGLVAATLSPNRYLSLAGYAIAGLGIATMLPTLYDTAAQHPGRPGVGLGALTAGLRIASLIIPLTVGVLAATNLSVGAAIAIVTLPSLLGYLVVTNSLSRA